MNYECQEEYNEAMSNEAEYEAECEAMASEGEAEQARIAEIMERESNTVNYNELCGMDKFKKILLREVAIEVNNGSYTMPQILVLIERVYNNFNFTDLHGTCKVGDGVKLDDLTI